jgi:hypothetical protein
MGVESKIRELLEGKMEAVEAEVEVAQEEEQIEEAAGSRPLDKKQGDATNPTQGSSNANPEMQDLSGTSNPEGGLTAPIGKVASGKASKDGTLPDGEGAGKAPNYNDGEDPRNVVGQGSSKGNVAKEETESEDEVLEEEEAVSDEELEAVYESEEELEEEVEEEDSEAEELFEADLAALFADEEHLSEDFKVKAASIFEAVVSARVTSEIQQIEEEIASQATQFVEEFKEEMVESIDKYLSYVTEQWLEQNELAVQDGLKAEITESFIKSLKNCFEEHYIEMPEEKLDVLADQRKQIDELQEKLDAQINENIEASTQLDHLKKQAVFEEVCEGLAQTEAEKFAVLVEDVTYDDMYQQKLEVIKENYFPKEKVAETEKLSDEGVEVAEEVTNSIMAKYATAISKSAKF